VLRDGRMQEPMAPPAGFHTCTNAGHQDMPVAFRQRSRTTVYLIRWSPPRSPSRHIMTCLERSPWIICPAWLGALPDLPSWLRSFPCLALLPAFCAWPAFAISPDLCPSSSVSVLSCSHFLVTNGKDLTGLYLLRCCALDPVPSREFMARQCLPKPNWRRWKETV
jgi:hypothetical protein